MLINTSAKNIANETSPAPPIAFAFLAKTARRAILFLALACAVCSGATDSKPNVLLICVDDLRPELNCYGKSYIHSPNIDKLSAEGRRFTNHYVQAPTCGASRFALLTGRYGPSGNHALFSRGKSVRESAKNGEELAVTKPKDLTTPTPTMPHWFRKQGYTTVSVGKVSHHPGGRGGKDWDDNEEPEMPLSWTRHLCPTQDWKHPRGIMHGLANGEIRMKADAMDVFQSFDGPDAAYPDGIIIDESLRQLEKLTAEDTPFFLAVGIIRPHLPFGAPKAYMQHYVDSELPPIPHSAKPSKDQGKTTWHGSGEFMKYNRWKRNPNDDAEFATEVRKHYAACVTFADAQVGKLIKSLKESGKYENTIIVVWGDHGWHLGEHAVWGKHTLFEESLHSPLIIRAPKMKRPGVSATGIVESIDIMPTLAALAGLDQPAFVDGTSLLPMMDDPDGNAPVDTSQRRARRTIRTRAIGGRGSKRCGSATGSREKPHRRIVKSYHWRFLTFRRNQFRRRIYSLLRGHLSALELG